MQKKIEGIWYGKNKLAYVLWPLSLLYRFVITIRRFMYQINIFKTHHVAVPVIVVGNITVGGTGKTPLVIVITKSLQKQGVRVGVITRGYGGKSAQWPQVVTQTSRVEDVGDEAIVIARNLLAPVVVGPNRVDNANYLLQHFPCDVLVSDDGLQHYALARDIEIAVIDGSRQLGNGFCLPAGPLREPTKRLKTVDFVVVNGLADKNQYAMQFVIDELIGCVDDKIKLDLSTLQGKKIRAIAGIGNPARFFALLKSLNIIFSETIFPDHHSFSKNDFEFMDDDIILMTEKDAVKCLHFADHRFFVACGHGEVDVALIEAITRKINTPFAP